MPSSPSVPRAGAPLQTTVVVGSTRAGRVGSSVARWFAAQCALRDDMAVDIVELADLALGSALPPPRGPSLAAWAACVDRADAIVVVTPEYNHGYPAALKQAVDVLHAEWHAKPVAFVSYGGISGGLRAVEQLRQVFAELHTVTIRNTVSFANVGARLDTSGRIVDDPACRAAAAAMADQLSWWGYALRTARAATPYAA